MPELYITPSNYRKWTGAGNRYVRFQGHNRILNARPRKSQYGTLSFAKPLVSTIPLIPREEWQDRIAEKDKNKSWLYDIREMMGLPCKDQDSLGYCHAYGPVTAAESLRAMHGLPYVELSAESVGGIVTNWQNEGAWPEDDLEVLCNRGACAASYMDRPNSITPTNWKPGWEQDALLHTCIEAFDIDGTQIFEQLMTCVLYDIPTSVWFNWWAHCIHGPCQAKFMDGRFWLKHLNNWGKSWGDNGYAWMAEGYGNGLATPDGAFGLRVMRASDN